MATLKINRGTTYLISYNHQHDGVTEPLTGATVFFTVKTTEYSSDTDDSDAVISKTITSHVDAAAGETEIEIEPDDTATLTPGTYFYDVIVKESDDRIYKVDEGKIKLDGSPTNRTA